MIYPARILALDFETTGFSSQYDHITQVGAAVLEEGEVKALFQSRVRPTSWEKFKASIGALKVQIGDDLLDKKKGPQLLAAWWEEQLSAPLSSTVAADFAEWLDLFDCAELPLVIQKADFDLGFLEAWIFPNKKSLPRRFISPVTICTLAMAKQVLPRLDKHDLDSLATELGLPVREGGHSAPLDAVLAGQVYFALRRLIQEKEPKTVLTLTSNVASLK